MGLAQASAALGHLHAKRDRRIELKELMLSFAAKARTEDGCLEYELLQDRNDPDILIFYEVWRTQEDMQRHLEQQYMKVFMDGRMAYLERDVQVQLLSVESPRP